ncbi:MAG: serine/threonine protein kinase [Actinomycetota bacterium]|nr:serine/threonine protein kinase [Actinomycetota bacterium]
MSVQALTGGRYRIEEPLGHGGMASVYLAHDERLGRLVAIKLLAENLAGDDALRERFVREARLAARLAHPNVVQVFDSGEDEGRPYIVMEYIEGQSLAELVRQGGKLAPQEVVAAAQQVCAGLEHAHERGLVHRDLKPGNLLRRDDGCVKIADFGIARAAETTRLTLAGTILGTATYLSPEQAMGAEATPASDVYTLGITLYELLTGHPPYRIESLADLPAKHREGAIPPNETDPDVPPALAQVVMSCLAVDPARRPRSAAELERQLTAAAPTVRSEAPTAATVSIPVSHHRPSPTRRWIGLAAVLLVAGTLAIVLATRGDNTTSPPPVSTPKQGGSPAEQARNLGDWLRASSR